MTRYRYFVLGRGARYCDERVCLSVCPLTYFNKKAVRCGAMNHRAMPLLLIPPSSFAQNLETFP